MRLAASLLALAFLGGCIQVQVGDQQPSAASSSSASRAPERVAGIAIDFTWTPEFPRSGEGVRFQATATGLAGRTIDTWAWDFGDNGTGKGPTLTHAFRQADEHTVVLRALASDGSTLQAVHRIFVLAPGQATPPSTRPNGTAVPVADLGPQPLPTTFLCPDGNVTEPSSTFGRADGPPGLAWAVLKTGFRLAVGWTTEQPTAGSLSYVVAGSSVTRVDETVPTRLHLIVVDGLPVGKDLCFQATGGPWHGVHLANAMTAFEPAEPHGTYTMNLMAIVNEGGDVAEVEEGMDRYAEMLWDATDGWVRAGASFIVVGDYLHHNSGWPTCYIGGSLPGACANFYDVVVTEAAVPQGAASTYRQGIRDDDAAMWMNMHWQAVPGPLSLDDFGAVLLHEVGHYAFDMDDLYGDPVVPDSQGCDLPEWSMSIMGGSRDATEFDDEVHPCPTQGSDYVPSWTLMRGEFPEIADRTGDPLEGPAGHGGQHVRQTFRALV